MALLLSTTGTQNPVILYDLGERSFAHPTVNLNLELEYPLWELLESADLAYVLLNGYVTLNFDGNNINIDEFNELARGNMQTFTYDVDNNGIVDNASTAGNSLQLQGNSGAFYLDRANHTGTQLSTTISDFTTAVSAVVTATSGTAGFAIFAGTAGWATNAAHSFLSDHATLADTATNANHATLADNANDSALLQGQNGAYYLNRANHTGTQTVSTISDLAINGTSGWAINAANAYQLNNQPASFYLNTNSSINSLIDVDTVSIAPINADVLNYSTSGTGNWVPINPKSIITRNTWLLSAGVNAISVTDRYCDWWGGAMNLSGYVVPVNATIQYISANTNAVQTWTAEVRQNGTNVAQLAITALASARSSILNVNVSAGDIITLFVTGTAINRPTITVHFVER